MSAFAALLGSALILVLLGAFAAYLLGIPLWAVILGSITAIGVLVFFAGRRSKKESVRQTPDA